MFRAKLLVQDRAELQPKKPDLATIVCDKLATGLSDGVYCSPELTPVYVT